MGNVIERDKWYAIVDFHMEITQKCHSQLSGLMKNYLLVNRINFEQCYKLIELTKLTKINNFSRSKLRLILAKINLTSSLKKLQQLETQDMTVYVSIKSAGRCSNEKWWIMITALKINSTILEANIKNLAFVANFKDEN